MDIGSWLLSLGLEQYEALFRENDIDAEVIGDLTDADLEKIGVTLGHRKRLLKAIAELASADKIALPTSVVPLTTAERRPITVMFCDLVGSTGLSARLDPEDTRSIIVTYQKAVAAAVQAEGGFIAKFMGDGIVAYFGYPQAEEHDAERAARAGLAVVDAVGKLKSPLDERLRVRVGVATGMAVVGDLIGSGESSERSVVGDTPNIAARLQGLARPDCVVISESTRRLIGDLFELEDLGPLQLKGFERAARAFLVLRARSFESRFEALHADDLTELVGRERELEVLTGCWARAKSDHGQVVLISGEPGIGKSRLTVAFMEQIADEPHTRLRYFCSPQHSDSALYPFIGRMERAAGIASNDEPKAKLDKLDALLIQSGASLEDASLLASMLSLPNDGRHYLQEMTSLRQRQLTLQALISQIEGFARKNPVLIVFEDVHWADPSSLETLARLAERIHRLEVLVVVTFRPDFTAPWPADPSVTAITLGRLTDGEIDVIIDSLAGNKTLPRHLRKDIVERADGVPLFAEEITKAVLEAEGRSTTRTIEAIPSPFLDVPASLHVSLLSRLDRLGSAKETAQIGAAIGREFSHALLAAVAQKSEFDLVASVTRLVDAGLVFRQGVPSDPSYLFKHALIQDAAYSTLLREARRSLHMRIADALETQFPDVIASQPATLARHFGEAGQVEKAAILWGKAGQQSVSRSALAEAEAQLKRALALIESLPSTPTRRRERITLEVALIAPLMHIKGYAAPETKTAIEQARQSIERAEQLGEGIEDPLLLFTVIYSFWAACLIAFNGDTACGLSAQFLTLAEQRGAEVPLLVALRAVGVSSALAGDIAKARPYLDRAVELSESNELRAQALRFGQDARATALSYRAWLLWGLGYPESAVADAERASTAAREIGHAASLMHALAVSSMCLILSGNYDASTARCDELVVMADEKGSALWRAWGMLNRGCVLVLSGKASEAEQVIRTAIVAFRSTGATVWTPCYLTFLARALSAIGRFEEALALACDAMAITRTSGELWFVSDIHRTIGEIALLGSEPNLTEAQSQFVRALEIARERKARSFELRAAISLARFWCAQEKRVEAHDVLAAAYSWFTEGFDTTDLKEARALLEELG